MTATFTHDGCTQCQPGSSLFTLTPSHVDAPDAALTAALLAAPSVSAAEFEHLASRFVSQAALPRKTAGTAQAFDRRHRPVRPCVPQGLPLLATVVLDWESRLPRHVRSRHVDDALASWAATVMDAATFPPSQPASGPASPATQLEQLVDVLTNAPRLSDALEDARFTRIAPGLANLNRSWDERSSACQPMGAFVVVMREVGVSRQVPWVVALELLGRHDRQSLLPPGLDVGTIPELEPGLFAAVRAHVTALSATDRGNLLAMSATWTGTTRSSSLRSMTCAHQLETSASPRLPHRLRRA